MQETPADLSDLRLETAAQVLHERRHRMGTGQVCDRCRDDVQAVLEVLHRPGRTSSPPNVP